MSVVCAAACLLVGGLVLSGSYQPGGAPGVTFRDIAYEPCATVTESVGDSTPVGTTVEPGDTVFAGKKGRVVLRLPDKSLMTLAGPGRVKCDDLLTAPDSNQTPIFSVLQGLFLYVSGLIGKHDQPDNINIEAPVGEIGIRGSVMTGEVLSGGKLLVHVIDGTGILRPNGKPNFYIPAGEGVLISSKSYQETLRLPPGSTSLIPARDRPPSITDLRATGAPKQKPVVRFKLNKTAQLKFYVHHGKRTLLTLRSRGKVGANTVKLSRPLSKGWYTVELIAAHHGLTSIKIAPLRIR